MPSWSCTQQAAACMQVPGAYDKYAADWYEKLCLFETAHKHYTEQLEVRLLLFLFLSNAASQPNLVSSC